MQISAIGSVSPMPYIYNTNKVSAKSLDKVDAVSNDVKKERMDFSELSKEAGYGNPLKLGESSNYMDIISMQMQIGATNAARLFE